MPLLRFYAGRNEHQNAREAVASVNSYRRHFGPRAVEAAEADLLGKALEALREFRSTFDGAAYVECDHPHASFVQVALKIESILSQAQAREVTR